MKTALKMGQETIDATEVISLLGNYNLLPQLAKEIAVDHAIEPIEATSEEVEQVLQRIYAQHQLQKTNEIELWHQQRGIKPEKLQNQIARQIKLEKFKQNKWSGSVESYFLQRKRQLDSVIFSLIQVQDAAQAKEIYFRILEGEDSFEAMAQQYSQGNEAQNGGKVGPMSLGTCHPIISQLLASSELGQVLPPTRIKDWFILVRLDQEIPAQLNAGMRQNLIDELFTAWLNQQALQLAVIDTES
jgi:parvulin-like peptidyl-prolyl isomerase